MTSKEYVIKKIQELVSIFPTVKCRYEHHTLSDTHFVEVVPNSLYKLDKDYLKWEEDNTFLFAEMYPSESLCFISDDALIGIHNTDFQLQGKDYNVIYTIVKNTLITSKSEQINWPSFTQLNFVTDQHNKVISELDTVKINVDGKRYCSNKTIKCEMGFKKPLVSDFTSNTMAA